MVPAIGCGGQQAPRAEQRTTPPVVSESADGGGRSSASPVGGARGPDAGIEAATPRSAECPEGMAHVKQDFCPKMERRCLKEEYDKANHIVICHRFEEAVNECKALRFGLDFCIDEYEFPNRKGAHPPVMIDWYHATGECAALGKRLCYESEWVAACEGPNEKPFPYGWQRSPEKCNIDNAWVTPSLDKIYSRDPDLSGHELARLDRSVPSGSRAGCVSDYGVFDLTGNVDEWVLADHDRPKEKGIFAALKGGAWGHVRNACRPVTTSHEPEFRYYFVSFRCCKDAASVPAFEGAR